MSNYILRKGRSSIHDLTDGGAVDGYPGDYPGRVYFVNNITGASGNDGLSWHNAFDEVSPAVTAAEAYRLSFGATNVYIRNVIYVQGTGTAYSHLHALPNYCDIVGIGANPRGNGSGIASISSITGHNSADDSGTAGVRGLGLYNLQFTGAGTGYGLDVSVMFRSTIENCVFVNKSTGGIRIVKGGGLTIRNCQIGGGDTVNSGNGLENSGTDNFNDCLIEDNFISGTAYGVIVNAYLCNATLFRNNTIYGATEGVHDTCADSNILANAWYSDNFIMGADAMVLTNNSAARTLHNYVNNGTNGVVENEATP